MIAIKTASSHDTTYDIEDWCSEVGIHYTKVYLPVESTNKLAERISMMSTASSDDFYVYNWYLSDEDGTMFSLKWSENIEQIVAKRDEIEVYSHYRGSRKNIKRMNIAKWFEENKIFAECFPFDDQTDIWVVDSFEAAIKFNLEWNKGSTRQFC